MDFAMGLLLSNWKNNSIWAIVDRLTKYAHLYHFMTLGV